MVREEALRPGTPRETLGPRQLYYYFNGHRIGDVGNDGPSRADYAQALARDLNARPTAGFRYGRAVASADFDQNYEPISKWGREMGDAKWGRSPFSLPTPASFDWPQYHLTGIAAKSDRPHLTSCRASTLIP
ncbi:MAG: hypothetical protein IV086_06325 [Hyphomonadaceae bacterium]|nr:hypothetical protein [Hyphomonadaceae bacterium]